MDLTINPSLYIIDSLFPSPPPVIIDDPESSIESQLKSLAIEEATQKSLLDNLDEDDLLVWIRCYRLRHKRLYSQFDENLLNRFERIHSCETLPPILWIQYRDWNAQMKLYGLDSSPYCIYMKARRYHIDEDLAEFMELDRQRTALRWSSSETISLKQSSSLLDSRQERLSFDSCIIDTSLSEDDSCTFEFGEG